MEDHKLHSVMLGTASSQPEWRRDCSASPCCDQGQAIAEDACSFLPSFLAVQEKRKEGKESLHSITQEQNMQSTEHGEGFCGNKDKPGVCNILVGGVVSC